MDGETATRLLELAMARPATLGAGRLIAVDGPSGSGKTTLARSLVAAVPGDVTAGVVHLDDLYAGWDGLATIGAVLEGLLRPLAAGRRGTARLWDWTRDLPGGDLPVDPVDLLVVEGVGAGHRAIADLTTVLVWLRLPAEGPDRALQRDLAAYPSAAADPAAYAGKLERWRRSEAAHFAVDTPWERADVTLG